MTGAAGTGSAATVPTPNPLIAAVDTTVPWYAGITLVEGIVDVRRGIAAGSWMSQALGSAFVGVDASLLMIDPLGSAASWAVGSFLEHVRPLAEWLDALAGNPHQVEANAPTWANVGANNRQAVAELQLAVWRDIPNWEGKAAIAYRARIATEMIALHGYAEACEAKAEAVRLSGMVVLIARTLVRDLIADLVATIAVRSPMWTAELGLSAGLATPLVMAQVGTLTTKGALRIATVIDELMVSLRRLMALVRRLDDYTEGLKARPRGGVVPRQRDGYELPPARDLDADGRPDILDPDANADGMLDSLTYVPPPRSGQPDLPTKPMTPVWQHENNPVVARMMWPQNPWGVRYLSPDEAEQCRVFVRDGLLYGTDGRVVDTVGANLSGGDRGIFVMDSQGNIYLSTQQEVGTFHHSSFLAGQPVSAAGEIIVEDGRVLIVTNQSGHYMPAPESLQLFLDQLAAQGMDVSSIIRGIA
jgi:hypothetical protein